jgi:hypothetical protein
MILNAIAVGKTVDQYIKDTKEGKQDAAGFLTAGKAAGAITGNIKGIDVAAKTMELMGKPLSALESSLKTKGISMDGGDLYITVGGKPKKLDVSASVDSNGQALKAISFAIGKDKSVGTGNLNQAGISSAQIRKGLEFLDSKGVKWKLTGGAGAGGPYANSWAVEKAGYGTMKLNPNVPTIVGDRGPEMAFGGMIIPNMAKVPFSSPRYDVSQAAKMFEPMTSSSSGSVINLTQNIYPSDGMNTDAFVRQVVSMTKQAIGQDAKLNAKMVGTTKNVSIKS